MSIDEALADRCRKILENEAGLTQKNMFGGLSFLLKGKMVCGVLGSKLVVRLDPGAAYDEALKEPHVTPMDFTGRPMRGFVYIHPEGLAHSVALKKWLRKALDFANSPPVRSRTRLLPRDPGPSASS